ncbi:peptidylprolyl isomerase [Paenibacillus sp. y28]|uniref:peptidylprolyl isomerase n=1 Tax=Paenibacillus sp. y28 TaxID=3129110 RepID=UPI0030189B35
MADIQNSSAGRRGVSLLPWILLVVVIVAALAYILASGKKTAAGEAVATVNGEVITKDVLYDELVKQGGTQTLDTLITKKLLEQEAKKRNVTVTDEDVNSQLEDIKKSFPSEEEFTMALTQYGMTLDQLKEQIRPQALVTKILTPEIQLSDDDKKKYFEDNKASYNKAEQIKASHILVATKEEADAILAQLKNGADFATLAKEKSTDTGSKANGGDLGYFERGKMVTEFDDAAFKLNVGETTTAPVQTQFGFHIIKLVDKKPAVTATYEDKKAEVEKQMITEEVGKRYQEFVDKLKQDSKIDNTLAAKA